MAKLRVLGIGAGYFSQFQYLGWRNIPEVECVAIVNRDTAKAQALAARFGIPRVFGDLDQALEETRPDLVDLIMPPATHRAYVGAIVAHKVPVICQKPFGQNYAEALAITELAERAGVPLVIHENYRWDPAWREVKRIVDAGTLGRLHCISFRLRPGDGQGPRAYLDRQPAFQRMPRLLVNETAIHWIDTYRFVFGEITAVYARLRRMNPVLAGEDAGYIVFEFASGATGLFDGNRSNDHVAANPRRTMGEAWIEGASRRVAHGWRCPPVVETAPAAGGRARLRPRTHRHFRRRRLRMAAAPRRRPFHFRRAPREHGARVPDCLAGAGGGLSLGAGGVPHRDVCF